MLKKKVVPVKIRKKGPEPSKEPLNTGMYSPLGSR